MTTLRWGSATDVGMVRETNQDSLLVAEPLFAVADGMGGHQGGEVASATALEILQGTFGEGTDIDDLREAVRRANAKVWDKAQLDDNLRGMGTTLTAAAKVYDESGQEFVAIVNVGDSRGYLLRDGELHQITSDHSFVGEMVRAGELTAEEAEHHPKRNIVTRALGVEPTVEADIELLAAQPDDRILLCSDGLTREVSDSQIAATLRRLRNPQEAAHDLVAQAKAHGGHDNITVIIVDVEADQPQASNEARKEDVEPSTSPKPAKRSEKRKESKQSKERGPRLFTVRVALFFLTIIGLLVIAAGSVIWYARASYFVGLEGQQLVIFQGRPEKVLWFEPTVVERTNVLVTQIPTSSVPAVTKGATQASLQDAQAYIVNLQERAAQSALASQVPAAEASATQTATGTTP